MPYFTSILNLQEELEKNFITTVKVVQYYLNQIEQSKDLNIYIEVFKEEALTQAHAQDKRRAAGETLGKLAGVVVNLKSQAKSVIDVGEAGHKAASKIIRFLIKIKPQDKEMLLHYNSLLDKKKTSK